jgi:Protein of unknown function (DUF2934)
MMKGGPHADPIPARQQRTAATQLHADSLKALIAKRAYVRYAGQGYRHGCALDDWLEAEREILSQAPPSS